MIDDWADFVCIAGLSFLIIVLGTWALPQLPEHIHMVFALSILLSSIYFVKQMVNFLIFKYESRMGEKNE